jgi:hypothetical protein
MTGMLAPLVLAACAGRGPISVHAGSSQVDPCATQVIIAFFGDQGSRPSDRFVGDVARADSVALKFVRNIGPGLFVFSLTAPDPNCRAALQRLRRDARVRSVDVDRRRGIS